MFSIQSKMFYPFCVFFLSNEKHFESDWTILVTSISFRMSDLDGRGGALSVCVFVSVLQNAWKCLRNRQIKLLKNYSCWNLKRLKLGHFLGRTLHSFGFHTRYLYRSRCTLSLRSIRSPLYLKPPLILPLDSFHFYRTYTNILSLSNLVYTFKFAQCNICFSI